MTVKRDDDMRTITDKRAASWLDGERLYYEAPKDDRPQDFNPYDLDESTQVFYRAQRLVIDSYGVEDVPPELKKDLQDLEFLSKLTTSLAFHVLGKVMKRIEKSHA